MGDIAKLHIAECAIEVVGTATYTYFLDHLTVSPDFYLEEWEFADGSNGQMIGGTRLFFQLDWGYFEGATGLSSVGHMVLVQHFQNLDQVNLIPDASQADKFEIQLDFANLKQIASIKGGTVNKGIMIPLKTKSRLTPAQLQYFNFI